MVSPLDIHRNDEKPRLVLEMDASCCSLGCSHRNGLDYCVSMVEYLRYQHATDILGTTLCNSENCVFDIFASRWRLPVRSVFSGIFFHILHCLVCFDEPFSVIVIGHYVVEPMYTEYRGQSKKQRRRGEKVKLI